jgi:hypothetical protein
MRVIARMPDEKVCVNSDSQRLLCTWDQRYDVLEHVPDESDDMEPCEGFGISLIVFDEAPAACGPGEGSFHDPASW